MRAHPPTQDIELPTVLRALSDPQRLEVVKRLLADPTPRSCSTFGLPLAKSSLTHHFRILREAGIIRQEENGTAKLNSLRKDDLDQRFPGLIENIVEAWDGSPLLAATP